MPGVYADTCVVINAFKGRDPNVQTQCERLLADTRAGLLYSDFHRLELLPKPLRERARQEIKFIRCFFSRATRVDLETKTVVRRAVELARKYGVKPLDALHLAAAIIGQADRFVTTEGSTSPILRVREIKVETFAD